MLPVLVYSLLLSEFSIKPAEMIPVGIATKPNPNNDIMLLKIFPAIVIGYISPLPTVVMVFRLHKNPEKAFSNTSGWTWDSKLYIIIEDMTISSDKMNIEDSSWDDLFTITDCIFEKACVYLLNFSSLNSLKSLNILKTLRSIGIINGMKNGSIDSRSIKDMMVKKYLILALNPLRFG